MMQKILLFLALCIPVTLFAQMNQTDSDGLRQGTWQKNYPNGNPLYKGTFNDGKPVGEWFRYHENGQVKAKIQYAENSDSAYTQLFSKKGEKVAEGVFIDEKKEGKWVYFSGNKKVAEEEFKNDQKHGISRKFYPSGEVLEETDWQNG